MKVTFTIEVEGSKEEIESFESSIETDVVCGVWDLEYKIQKEVKEE